MARQRQLIPLSFDPSNPAAVRVMQELAKVPHGQRSATIWAWLNDYLDGRARAQPESDEEDDDELDDLLDAL